MSEAARDLDETIRSGTVADSNVADEIERRVEDLIDDPKTFEADPDDGSDDDSPTATVEGSHDGQSSMEEYL